MILHWIIKALLLALCLSIITANVKLTIICFLSFCITCLIAIVYHNVVCQTSCEDDGNSG